MQGRRAGSVADGERTVGTPTRTPGRHSTSSRAPATCHGVPLRGRDAQRQPDDQRALGRLGQGERRGGPLPGGQRGRPADAHQRRPDRRVKDRFSAAHDKAGLDAMITRLRRAGASEVAIERGDGVLVDALLAAGLTVVVMMSRQVKNLQSRYGSSGAKDDRFDSFVLADTLPTDRARPREHGSGRRAARPAAGRGSRRHRRGRHRPGCGHRGAGSHADRAERFRVGNLDRQSPISASSRAARSVPARGSEMKMCASGWAAGPPELDRGVLAGLAGVAC